MRDGRKAILQFSDPAGAAHDVVAQPPAVKLDFLADDSESIPGDDELDEPTTGPTRLAGAGAALGSCFSVMIVVMALGSAASMSGPTGARAEIDSPSAAAGSPAVEPSLADGAAPDIEADAPIILTVEQTARLEALQREAMAAQAQVDAVQMRLSMLRTSLQQAALGQAEQSRQRAANAAVQAARYSWISADDLADGTRRRALEQLRSDQDAIRLLESQAQVELQRRRADVDAIEAEIAQWRRQFSEGRGEALDRSDPEATRTDGADLPAGLNPPIDRDLGPLIARHHARLRRRDGAAIPGAIPVD